MKVWKLGLLAPLALLCFLPGSSGHTLEPHGAIRQTPINATEFDLTITGRLGTFTGDGTNSDGIKDDKIRGLSYDLEVVSPRDIASGQASGKRQYKPLIVTKEWGASSPQILRAAATNELLPAVQLQFSDPRHSISLTNAHIVDVHHHPETSLVGGSTDKRQLEDVSFVFQKIVVQDDTTTFSDDLTGRR